MSFARQKPVAVEDWRALGSPKLPADARKYYRDRGVDDQVAKLNNLRFLRPEETAQIWPGIRSEALLFPYSRSYGTARLLDRDCSDKFRSTGDKGSRIYEPKLPQSFRGTMKDVKADPTRALIIGEGPTRALAAISNGMIAVSLSGCWNWQKDRQPLPGLLKYKWKGRKVTPIFDADIRDNNHVLLPYLLFGDWLSGRGANVQFAKLPGKPGSKIGLDDFLAKHGREGFDALHREDWDECTELEKLRISALRNTEGGLAALFTVQYGDDVRYDNEEECWYVWNGTLWVRQPGRAPAVQEYVKGSIGWIITEANQIKNEQRRKAMRKWGTSCDRKSVIRGAMDLASSDPKLGVTMAELDRDPYLLGTQSGVIDLRTGKLLKGERGQLISRSVATAFDPDAECPRWENFISEVMLGDKEMIAFMRRFVGYVLFGGNPERLIFFLHGVGRNGKSVFIETVLKLMGDYGGPAKSDLIMKHRADRDAESAQPFMLTLRGLRYISATEVGEGKHLDAMVVKDLTGQDEITVRGNYANPVRFTVAGKIVVRCNHRPIINGGDQAIWDRIVEVPFDLRIADDEQDHSLRDTLNGELPGILNWALDGCHEYFERGLQLPQKVKKQTESYRESMDTVAVWLKERTVEDSKARTGSGLLLTDYQQWCVSASKPGALVIPISGREFKQKLTDRGFVYKTVKGKPGWRGIKLVEDAL